MSDAGVDAVRREHGGSSEPLLALREVREASGLHIAALAAALKVPVRKLEALEAGRYDELPDLTFARALASSACRHLKVDPKPVLDQIPMLQKPSLGTPPHAISAPFKSSVPGVGAAPAAWFTRPSFMIAGALVVAALVLLVLPELERFSPAGQETVQPSSTQPTDAAPLTSSFPPLVPSVDVPAGEGAAADSPGEPVASTESEEPLQAEPANGQSPQVTAEAPPTGAASPQTAAVPSPAGQSTAVSPAAAAESVLYIAATGESWVEVTNGAGTVVAQRLLKPGEVLEFSSAPPYRVVLGRAEAARVLVRGQPFDVMPFARNSVARFEAR